MKFTFNYYVDNLTSYQGYYYIDDKDINEQHSSFAASEYYHRLDGPAIEYSLHPEYNLFYINGILININGRSKISVEEFIRLVKLKAFL